jgi:hypothetical protein
LENNGESSDRREMVPKGNVKDFRNGIDERRNDVDNIKLNKGYKFVFSS